MFTDSMIKKETTAESFIFPMKLVKPRPTWLLVAMSNICIIKATAALKFSRQKVMKRCSLISETF